MRPLAAMEYAGYLSNIGIIYNFIHFLFHVYRAIDTILSNTVRIDILLLVIRLLLISAIFPSFTFIFAKLFYLFFSGGMESG